MQEAGLKVTLTNGKKNTHLSIFSNKVCLNRGRPVAISATARILAVIIWNKIVKGNPLHSANYVQVPRLKKRKVQEMKRLIHKFNVSTNELSY